MSTAEISNLDISSMEGEEVILIQTINSIKTIIKLNPSSHEKVRTLWFPHSLWALKAVL